jgi:hypothetical protein
VVAGGLRAPGAVAGAAEIDRLAAADDEAHAALAQAIDVLSEIRRQKSLDKRPLKARIARAVVRWDAAASRGCARSRRTCAPPPASRRSSSGRRGRCAGRST